MIKNDGIISTDLYTKETDSFNYYPFHSSGPKHIARNIPYNLAKRVCTIVSNTDQRDVRLGELKKRLVDKNYPISLVENSISNAKKLNREDLLKPTTKNQKDKVITIVTEHNPNINDAFPKLKNILENLSQITKITNSNLEVPRIINSKKQPPNLMRQLALNHKRDNNLKNNHNIPDRKFYKCQDKRCKTCPNTITDVKYTTINGTCLKRNAPFSCQTTDIIYCLVCKKCKAEYIGETGDPLNIRMNGHRNQIKHECYRKLKVSKHINSCSNGEFQIFPFFKCRNHDHLFREAMEKHFRRLAKPQLH